MLAITLVTSGKVTKQRNRGSCRTVATQDLSASRGGQKFLLKATPCQENYPELLTSVSGMWGWSDAADILTPAESTVSTVSGSSHQSWRGAEHRAQSPFCSRTGLEVAPGVLVPSAGFALAAGSNRLFLAFPSCSLSQKIRIIVAAASEWEKKKSGKEKSIKITFLFLFQARCAESQRWRLKYVG